ncbi:MAG: AI-2E family transporter [Acidimicrobiia bacterium]
MPPNPPVARARVPFLTALATVGALALMILVLRIADGSQRVIGWILIAAAVAALVNPLVDFFDRWMPRGLAVTLVTLVVLSAIGGFVYGLVDDIVDQTRRLERAVPARAAELEESGSFSDAARELELEDRSRRLIKAIPERLGGSNTQAAIENTTERALGFLAIAIMTLFFVVFGRSLIGASIRQFPDPESRGRYERIVDRGLTRGLALARGTLMLAIIGGFIAYGLARAAGVPGPIALATWAALWNIVPIFGFVIGTAPIVVLAGANSYRTAIALAVVFIVFEVLESFVLRRWLERRTLRLGGFLTALAAFGGLELYGLAGALIGVLGAALLAGALAELAHEEDELAAAYHPP